MNSTSDGLLGDGVEVIGSELSLEDALIAARERFKGMALCAVEEWVLFDLVLTDEERAKVAESGCQPLFMFAHKVVLDEKRRFAPGDWVRSTICTSFQDGYLFATRNTVYVLFGPGHRKPSTLQGVFSIF